MTRGCDVSMIFLGLGGGRTWICFTTIGENQLQALCFEGGLSLPDGLHRQQTRPCCTHPTKVNNQRNTLRITYKVNVDSRL